ncbi:MAG: hypothetical protein IPG96_05475 [Proteobacteria bacterium]|nr:hypothetical protein [Pseudomonadota bacterium]
MADEHTNRGILSILDWTVVMVTVTATLGLFSFPVAVAPVWRSMLAAFGGELPSATALVLRPWFTPMLAMVPVVLLVIAWRGLASKRISIRRGLIVAAWAWSTAAVAFTLIAGYQPLFRLAGAIQP